MLTSALTRLLTGIRLASNGEKQQGRLARMAAVGLEESADEMEGRDVDSEDVVNTPFAGASRQVGSSRVTINTNEHRNHQRNTPCGAP